MSIEELLAVVRPPKRAVEIGRADQVPRIERELGISLPRDYIDFGLHYGSGAFLDPGRVRVTITNPFSKSYMENVRSDCGFLRQIKKLAPGEVPFGVFPKKSGLLAWGHDDNGWNLCWLTSGPPESWPVLFTNTRSVYFHRIDLSMTAFLAQSFSRQISTACWNWKDCSEFFSGPKRIRFVPAALDD
jgi:hypothetical protein